MRAAAVLMRMFLSLAPTDPAGKRDEIRSLLNEVVAEGRAGKRAGGRKRGHFQRKHRLLQWFRGQAGKPGLYGDVMLTEGGKFGGRRVSSVGSLKSLVVKMLRKVMPAFTQFGRAAGKGKRAIRGNAMLQLLAAQYNHSATNVGVARRANATVKKASPGFNPVAECLGKILVDTGQESRVDNRYNAAAQRAFNDETAEMLRHLEATVLDSAENSGFDVRGG